MELRTDPWRKPRQGSPSGIFRPPDCTGRRRQCYGVDSCSRLFRRLQAGAAPPTGSLIAGSRGSRRAPHFPGWKLLDTNTRDREGTPEAEANLSVHVDKVEMSDSRRSVRRFPVEIIGEPGETHRDFVLVCGYAYDMRHITGVRLKVE